MTTGTRKVEEMEKRREKLMEIALRLLTEKQVDVVLGFQRGTIPMMCQPILVTSLKRWTSFIGTPSAAEILPPTSLSGEIELQSWPKAVTHVTLSFKY